MVTSVSTSWNSANTAAAATNNYYRGSQGYLATVLTPEEHNFLVSSFTLPTGSCALGASQAESPFRPDVPTQDARRELLAVSLQTAAKSNAAAAESERRMAASCSGLTCLGGAVRAVGRSSVLSSAGVASTTDSELRVGAASGRRGVKVA